jgi:hypothetical protein
MMDHLRDQVLFAPESGSVEELAAVLGLLLLISTHPKIREAGSDFPRQAGLALQNESSQDSTK